MFIEIPNHGTINTEEISEVTENIIYQGHKDLRYVIIMKSGKEHTVNDQDYPRKRLSSILLNLTAGGPPLTWETIITKATRVAELSAERMNQSVVRIKASEFSPFTPKSVQGKFFQRTPRPR